jgi:DNA-binding PadR family transcriptional regulator
MFGHHHRHFHAMRRGMGRHGGMSGRFGGPDWEDFGGRGFRGGRVFDQGDLRLVVLKLIEEKPRHGYELIKAIEERLAGAYSPSPGVVYPTLSLLEELGHVALSSAEGGKKLYEITEAGRAFLAENEAAVAEVMGRIETVRAAFGAGPPPQIVRAIRNLRMALRLKLAAGDLTEEQAQAVAAALDEAAVKVERV